MPSPKQTYDLPSAPPSLGVKEDQVERGFFGKPAATATPPAAA